MPVVDELGDEIVALGRHPIAKSGQLRADGASGFLGLGGHPGVDGNSHRCVSLVMTARSTGAASNNSKPAARASMRGSWCGDHGGRSAPTMLAAKTGSALGQAMRPARPRRWNRPAAMLTVSASTNAAWRSVS